MTDEQRPASTSSLTDGSDWVAPLDDQEAYSATIAEQAADAPVGTLAEAWQIDPDDMLQEARGMAQRVIAQATGQADQAARAAGKQMTVAAAVVRKRTGSAADALGRRWWVVFSLLALGLAAVALSRRQGVSKSVGAEPETVGV